MQYWKESLQTGYRGNILKESIDKVDNNDWKDFLIKKQKSNQVEFLIWQRTIKNYQ